VLRAMVAPCCCPAISSVTTPQQKLHQAALAFVDVFDCSTYGILIIQNRFLAQQAAAGYDATRILGYCYRFGSWLRGCTALIACFAAMHFPGAFVNL